MTGSGREPVRALFAGLGGVGQRHLRNLRRLVGPDFPIDAYRVRGESRVLTDKFEVETGTELEKKYGIRAFDNLEEALGRQPSMVFVCNPSSMHMEVALAAARAGCHLFIEKPLSASWAGVDELIDITERRELVAIVGYQMRFHPCLRQLRVLLDAARVGAVLAVRAEVGEYLPGWHPYEDYRTMYASRRALGGGVVLAQIHEFDYLFSLFGLPRRVFAVGGHLSSLEIDVEDVASVLMECSRDGRRIPVHVQQDYVQRPPARTCRIVGDRGTIVADFVRHSVEVSAGDGPPETFSFAGFERNQMFMDEMTHFLACVRGVDSPVVPLRDAAQSLRMALAARESMETGLMVDLA